MNWRFKAATQRLLAKLPDQLSYKVYRTFQRHLGTLAANRKAEFNPIRHFNICLGLIRDMVNNGMVPEDKTFVEVGTGWTVNIPIGLWLCGAKKIITIDVNPFLTEEFVLGPLSYIKKYTEEIKSLFQPYSESPLFKERLDLLLKFNGGTKELLECLNIISCSPGDASSIPIEDHSVDCHYSESVLEYIGREKLGEIFQEAKRVLKTDGLLIHHIGLADQFSHFDSSITSINFLQFSDVEWERIAGNKYAFTPRLQTYDFDQIFQENGLIILGKKEVINQKALTTLTQGFPLAERFIGQSKRDLAVSGLYIVGRF